MDCVSFWVWFATGVFVVPFLELLKKVVPASEAWSWLLAPILSALAPVIAAQGQSLCAQIDPLLWAFLYAGAVYLVSQITYWVSKKSGVLK